MAARGLLADSRHRRVPGEAVERRDAGDHPLELDASDRRTLAAGPDPKVGVPQRLTPTALGVGTACVVALGASFAIARSDAESQDSFGRKPVRVPRVEAPFRTPALGREVKVPALPRRPAPEPVRAVRRQPDPVRPSVIRPEPVAPPTETVAPPPVSAPPPAAPPPPPAPPAPPAPPPPEPASEPALSFDDSG